jgi:hypothetical protein
MPTTVRPALWWRGASLLLALAVPGYGQAAPPPAISPASALTNSISKPYAADYRGISIGLRVARSVP